MTTYGSMGLASPGHIHGESMPMSSPMYHHHPAPPVPSGTMPGHSTLPPAPSLPDPIRDPAPPTTTIRRTSPKMVPTPPPTRAEPRRERPGRLFDQLNNPFDDDSASRTARRPLKIQRTNFSDESVTDAVEDDEFADYFRR
jgi:hypothetical protein